MINNEIFIKRLQKKSDIPSWEIDRVLRNCQFDLLQFSQTLVDEDWINHEVAARTYAEHMNFSYVNLEQTLFQRETLELLPQDLAEKYPVIPLYKLGDAITVATAHPEDKSSLDELSRIIMSPISPVFALPCEIKRAIKVNYQKPEDLKNTIDSIVQNISFQLSESNKALDKQQLETLLKSEQLKKIADTIVLTAIQENVSDIHIETKKYSLVVRYRIDGVLVVKYTLPKELALPLVSRFKVIAKLDIVEKRKPQDGRFTFELPSSKVDIRLSTVPLLFGEKIVLRLLGTRFSRDMLKLDNMAMFPEILKPLKKVLHNADGMLLVSGPTGSGKTTTLYSTLDYINDPSLNIVTIEDPVEYEDPSLNQIMVNIKEGRTFENSLRAVLRQDPDVILVGEIRDLETARIVSQAALTGHLVLTTIHTGSALHALTRLVDIGVERFLVAPSIIGILGQRLVRSICEYCKAPYQPDPDYMKNFFYWDPGTEIPQLYHGKGCSHCGGSGYRGRLGIHEFLKVDNVIRDKILDGCEHHELVTIAKQRGFKDLKYDGFRKVLLGLTTLEEVLRVTPDVGE